MELKFLEGTYRQEILAARKITKELFDAEELRLIPLLNEFDGWVKDLIVVGKMNLTKENDGSFSVGSSLSPEWKKNSEVATEDMKQKFREERDYSNELGKRLLTSSNGLGKNQVRLIIYMLLKEHYNFNYENLTEIKNLDQLRNQAS